MRRRTSKNDAFLARKSAAREIRALHRAHRAVPPELRARAGYTNGSVLHRTAKKVVERQIVERHGGADAVRILGSGTTKARQAAAKDLGIKNRRWMSVVELDEAINLATESQAKSLSKPDRLLAIEQLGRDRCQAAWTAWKVKQTRTDKDGGDTT